MDENEIDVEYVNTPSRRHDRWTFLVLSSNFVTQVLCETASFAGQLTEALAQHREYKIERDTFFEIVRGSDGDAS